MSFTTYDKGRPGVWFNFEAEAQAAVEGSDGVVAIVKDNYNVTATADTVYEFDTEAQARAIVGVSNLSDITLAFQGGAAKVIVYTRASGATDYVAAQAALQLQLFEALSFDHPLESADVTSWKTWLTEQTQDENYRVMVYGVDDDSDVAAAITRIASDGSEFIADLVNAPKFADNTFTSADFAPWVAGAYASTPLQSSITYKEVPNAIDVNVRLTSAQVKSILAAGGIAFEYNGRKVRLIRGVATNGTSLKRVAIKQALARDWKFLIEEKYIGKVANGPNERLSMTADLKNYLAVWEAQSIIEQGTWYVNVTEGPAKNQVIVNAFVRDLDTMEEVYITVGMGA